MPDAIPDSILAHHGIEMGEELKHYGRKGMKWGVVRERGPDGKVVSAKVQSEDHAKSRELKAKKTSEMSNAELKRVNERLQLERTNNELQSRTALAKIKRGTAIAGTLLAVGTTVNTVIQFAKSPAGQAIAKAVTKQAANPDWLF